MDPRFKDPKIFNKRSTEWNKEVVQNTLEKLFSYVELLDGWTFVKSEWKPDTEKKKVEELKPSFTETIDLTVKDPKGKEFHYKFKMPVLIMDQFFYIGGNLKVPIFQLFDHPVIHRPEKPGQIKLRTNILTLNVAPDRGGIYNVQLFKRKIPLHDLIAAVHTKDELEAFLKMFKEELSTEVIALANKCYDLWANKSEEDLTKEIGKYFGTVKNDEEKKGKGIIFSIKTANDVDFFSRRYFKSPSLLFEIIQAIQDGPISDTDLSTKRVRFLEYVLSPLVRKVYDMITNLKNSRKSEFKIPSTLILEECNASKSSGVSDIIHFNIAINPVGEIASLLQLTLTGPGGFKKSNVPTHLRTLDDSQFGYVCPADTPDREGCGVVLNMVPNIDLDLGGNFGKPAESTVTSYPISLTPFLANDDQTRLQMASNQAKQAILLMDSQEPMIKSGTEDCFAENSTYLYRAKDDGEVAHLSNESMVVFYVGGGGDVIKPYHRKAGADYMVPKLAEGDKFKAGDIIAESLFFKDGTLSLGRNLLTGVAIWKGWNYEDSIVISETVQREMFTSIHTVDLSFEIDPHQVLLSLHDDKYIPLPKIGQKLKKGEVYAKIKGIDTEADLELINIEPVEKTSPLDCVVSSVEIYPNNWSKHIEEHDTTIQKYIVEQTRRFSVLQEKILQKDTKNDGDAFIKINDLSKLDTQDNAGKYHFDRKKLKGVLVKIRAVYKENIGIGDKIANRHGNKGVIGLVVPDEKMPTLPDGRKMDVIINPLGIISRMNAGQLFELHLSECLYQLKQQLHELKGVRAVTKHLKSFLEIIDKSDKKWTTTHTLKQFKSRSKENLSEAIDKLTLIQPAFQSISPYDLLEAMNFIGTNSTLESIKDEELLERCQNSRCLPDKYPIYDPEEDEYLANPIACGYIYFLKLVHRATDKTSARSIGPYSQKTLQPLGGRTNLGGHRIGEMEVWALAAYGADNLLKDLLTTHSDSSGLKNKMLAEVLQNRELVKEDDEVKPASLSLLESNLRVLGMQLDHDNKPNDDIVDAELSTE